MSYHMFLDDDRMPPKKTLGQKIISWFTGSPTLKVVRNVNKAKKLCLKYGCPSFISFDHDLGDREDTGYDFAHWLVKKDQESPGFIPPLFKFYVHSQNPIGARNIQALLNNYLKQRG